jgi:hypothetical protein
VRLTNVRHLLRLAVLEPAAERLLGLPRAQGVLLGGFDALRAVPATVDAPARDAMTAAFRRVAAAAAAIGARTAFVMVPAAAQVCSAEALPYWPRPFDVADPGWDMDRPQRMLAGIADELGVPAFDLRPVLRAMPSCPYQPHNMHWLPAGHEQVARAVAGWLSVDQRALLATPPARDTRLSER